MYKVVPKHFKNVDIEPTTAKEDFLRLLEF